MAKITIDGREIEFDGKKMILQVAIENGIEIPHYCYHPGLSIAANCRICLAEVESPNPRNDNKLELIPKLLPTCQTMAADGMVVHTTSPKAVANQKAVMEYLLINHPLDCAVCDQAGECYLQDYSYQYGRSQSRFIEDKAKQPKKDVGPHVLLYADRCIMCSRCVRFTREVTGTNELGIFGRGHREQIDVFPGKALDNELSGNVIDICPVGALLDKDFLFAQRVWYLKHTPSIDGLTAGGDNIWVHHNDGQVYRIKPRENADVNKWWISDEVRYGWKFVHSEERLSRPKRLQFGTQDDTRWDRAYEEVKDKLRQAVAEKGEGALAAVISPMLSCEEAWLLARLVRGLDAKAQIAIGPVPVDGKDKTFPGGYTVYAEKAPNARGVRRAIQLVTGDDAIVEYDALVEQLGDKKSPVAGLLITGNYPSNWTSKELLAALKGRFAVAIETLANPVAEKADVLLPGATWLEKEGTFENANDRLQRFEQAIPVLEGARSEGQIALDLLAACNLADPQRFDAAAIRQQMGGVFETDVHHPEAARQEEPAMQWVELTVS